MFRQTVLFIMVVCSLLVSVSLAEEISTPILIKTTALPAIASMVNGGRVETFTAGATSDEGHPLEYQFTWGDGNIGPWGTATQTHVYTYFAAITYNVTVQARCTLDGTVSAVSAPLVLASEPVRSTSAIYADWCAFGRCSCWAYPRNCNGDADGKKQGTSVAGYVYVNNDDLDIFAFCFGIKEPPRGPGAANTCFDPDGGGPIPCIPCICADFNRDGQGTAVTGIIRVSTNDLPKLVASWMVKEPTKGIGVQNCFSTGQYHYMVEPEY